MLRLLVLLVVTTIQFLVIPSLRVRPAESPIQNLVWGLARQLVLYMEALLFHDKDGWSSKSQISLYMRDSMHIVYCYIRSLFRE